MKNKHVKTKKEVLRSFVWATICVGLLLCAALGILYYMLGSDMQFSPITGKLLWFWLVIGIILLSAIFVWKFWYRNAFKKYTEAYEKEREMLKRNRAVTAYIFFIIILGIGIGWFFGHHRSAQKMLNAEPAKIYKAVEPLKPKDQPSNIRETTTSTHVHEEDASVTSPISDMENKDTDLNPAQSNLSENTKVDRDTPTSQENKKHKHEEAVSKEAREASKKLLAEAEKALEEAKQIQKEGLEMIRETMPIVANHLNTLSTEEQIETLRQLKTTMLNQTSQFPPELQSLIEEHNVIEEGWKMYLDMLAEAGYTPPRDFE